MLRPRKPKDLYLDNYYKAATVFIDDDGQPFADVAPLVMSLKEAVKLYAWLSKYITWAQVKEKV